ncbi:MAG: hypothetical protein IKL13_05315 [Clostridia bacterium]|nr:hypothetical protein [Clostridia bacterium]
MLKRIALICALIFLLGGCSLPSSDKPDSPTEEYGDPAKYADEFRHNMQYQQLSGTEQHAYGQVYTALRDHEKTDSSVTGADGQELPGIRIPLSDVRFTREQISHLFETFFRDNPRFFYLDRTYSLEGYDHNGKTVYDTLLLQFTMDTEQRIRALDELDKAVTAILSDRPHTADDYEVELYLHDRLLTSCVYDDEAASASSDKYANAYSAYGALIEGRAVCEGYAKAMQLLLNASSIPTTVVLGHAVEDGEAHMWNLVSINGSFYYLDPTWNDDDADNRVHYTYFNITSDMLSRTHIPEKGAFVIDCTAQTDNYHHRNGTYIDTYERDVIAKVIANRVSAGDTAIQLRFADGKYENALLFLKNLTLTHKTVNKYLRNNTMWDYELRTQPKQTTIIICKK